MCQSTSAFTIVIEVTQQALRTRWMKRTAGLCATQPW